MVQHTPQQFTKVLHWVSPAAHAASVDIADVDTPLDTIGFRYARVVIEVGAMAGTWNIQVEASDTAAGSYADITGALFSLIAANDDQRFIGDIDLLGSTINKNRFLQLNGVASAAINNLAVSLILFAPIDASRYVDISGAAGVVDTPIFQV